MSTERLDDALDEAARPLRGMSGLARLTLAGAVAVPAIALAAWLLRLGVGSPAWLTLLAWSVALIVPAIGFVMARRAIRALGPWHVAERLEAEGAWRRGALTTVLDPRAEGTSEALHALAADTQADDVARRASGVLQPAVGVEVRRTRRAAAVAAGGLLALVAAGPLGGATARLWHPIDAWQALLSPVRLVARASTVDRGASATFDVTAIGQRHATLLTRAPGEGWQSRDVALDADGRAVVSTAPLSAELVARVEAGGRRSDEVRIAVRLPAFLGAFTITAHYPAYLQLEDEALPTGGDTLVIPEGTRLAIAGRATTPLRDVRLDGPGGVRPLTVDGMAFRGELVPLSSGAWQLAASPSDGGTLEGELPQLPIRVLPDSAPAVDVPVPGADTIAPPSLLVPLVVSARDDHGLSQLVVEARRTGAGGVTRIPLTVNGDRALAPTQLDLGALGLKAGDTLRYVAFAADNAPAHHVGRSREFMIRVPSEREQRAARADATSEAGASADSVAAAAKRAQRLAEDLARERQRTDGKGSGDGEKQPMSLETARKAEAAAQAQEKVAEQTKELARKVAELQKAAEREGLADSALARQLGEIRQLLDKAMTPELQEKLAALREAMKDLDADRTRDALQDLAKKQAEMKDALEQARELFKRAALESELANLSQEAKQLAQEQHAATEKLAKSDSTGKSAAEEEKALASRADSLAKALEQAAQKVPSQSTKDGLRQASQQASQAAQKMQQAAKQAQQGQKQEAKQSGKDAEQQLDPLEQQISEQRQEMQEQMREEVIQALERALQETSRLAQRQMTLAEQFRRGALVAQSRGDQGTVEEGAGKLMQQVTALAAKNALVPPQAGVALAAARVAMRSAIDAVSSASPNLRDAADQAGDAVDALAVAAFNLLRAKDKISGSQSGSGLQEAMEQMQQMAGKQGQLNQQANGMQQQGQGGMEQLMQMAMQQRAIAQQMERMRAGGQTPGAGEMAREAKEIARNLEAGRLTRETVERQERLFKKMLDAGRSLQGEEKDETKERKSEQPKDANAKVPPALDPRLRRGEGDVRLPGWEELQRLSPEDRRRVVDYFRRLAEGGGR